MEYIDRLYILAQDYWIITMIVGILSTFVESFLPILPLMAIVSANAVFFGLAKGFLISWIGSGLGTIALFLLVSRLNNSIFLNKFRNKRVYKAIHWLDRQGFRLLFIAYACPFTPGCLVTVASGLCKKKLSEFIPAMLSGKFVMFLVISYVSSDIKGFITSPIKICLLSVLVFISWEIGKKFNVRLENYEENKQNRFFREDKMKEIKKFPK